MGPLVVPLGKAHPLPGKGQRLDACQLVVALLVGADVLHGELPVGVDADAPQGVNHLHKAGEIHPQVVGDIHPVQRLQGVHRGLHPVDARVGQLVHGAPCLGEGHVEIPGRGQQEQALFPGVHRRQDVHVAAGQGGHRPKGIAAAEVDHEPFRGLLGDRGQRRLLLHVQGAHLPHACFRPLIAPGVGEALLIGHLQHSGLALPLPQGVRQGKGRGILLPGGLLAQGLAHQGEAARPGLHAAVGVASCVLQGLGGVVLQDVDAYLPLGRGGLGHLVQGVLGLAHPEHPQGGHPHQEQRRHPAGYPQGFLGGGLHRATPFPS